MLTGAADAVAAVLVDEAVLALDDGVLEAPVDVGPAGGCAEAVTPDGDVVTSAQIGIPAARMNTPTTPRR